MPANYTNFELIRRLLGLAWNYRWSCLLLLVIQGCMLLLAIGTLQGVGFGIDLVRFHAGAVQESPQLPFNSEWIRTYSPLQTVALIAAAVLLIEITRALLHAYSMRLAGDMVHARIVVDLRWQVYNKLQRLGFRFFDEHPTGSIINRVTSDVQSVRAFIDGVLIQLVILVVSLVCYVAYMSSIHVWLTLACLATTPGLWLLTVTFSRLVRPKYDEHRELVDTLILRLSENIQGIAVVKGFGREAVEIAKFEAANNQARDQQRGIFWLVSSFTPFIGFLTQINLVVLLAYGGWLVTQGSFSLGSGLVVFAGLLQQFSSQVANMTNLTNSIQQSLSGARRVFEILDAPGEVQVHPHAKPLPRAQGSIAFEQVTFGYLPDTPRLRNVSFSIAPGESVAILGATGAGKTTLLNLISRFYDPQQGRVLIDGTDAREWNLHDLRRNIGLVFQETFLFSNTVLENIAYGAPHATREQIEQAAKIAAAHEFIVQLPQGYDTVLGEAGLDLSGGQRQRLAIARALVLDPAILLLDDPAAAVDTHTEELIFTAMEQAMRGRTTLFVAHRLGSLRRANKIVVLEQGQIVQVGSFEELFEQDGHFRNAALAQLAAAAVCS